MFPTYPAALHPERSHWPGWMPNLRAPLPTESEAQARGRNPVPLQGQGTEASMGQGCLIPAAWSPWWLSATAFKLTLWAPAVALKGS